MSTSTAVQSEKSTTSSAAVNKDQESSIKKKKNCLGGKRETYPSSESEDPEVPETPKSSKVQKSESSVNQTRFRHSKTILRHDTTNNGLVPQFRSVLTAVGVKNWDSNWADWETVEAFLCTEHQYPKSKMANADIEVLKIRDPFLLGIRTFNLSLFICVN